MSSFTDKLIVSKQDSGMWRVERSFDYHVGSEDSEEIVTVPKDFETDFASVPRLFWTILPPDGKYTQAATLHDYLYHSQKFKRKKCDKIFIEAMKVLGVSFWKRRVMYRAVRMFGWIPWNNKRYDEETNHN